MLGAIIGDIVGSRFEWQNIKTKEFDFFHNDCFYTDDSVMTLAVAQSLLDLGDDNKSVRSLEALSELAVKNMQYFGRREPGRGYGNRFYDWLFSDNPTPYNSWGNGAAMRVSPCGDFAKTIEDAEDYAFAVTKVTHNHTEGIKGAAATAGAIFLAKSKKSKDEIKKYVSNYYDIDFTLDEIRDSYKFNESCQETVPQAIVAFLEATDFEDALRNAISIGGDSDTLAAITGSIAEAYFGIPADIKEKALTYLPHEHRELVKAFYNKIAD